MTPVLKSEKPANEIIVFTMMKWPTIDPYDNFHPRQVFEKDVVSRIRAHLFDHDLLDTYHNLPTAHRVH